MTCISEFLCTRSGKDCFSAHLRSDLEFQFLWFEPLDVRCPKNKKKYYSNGINIDL